MAEILGLGVTHWPTLCLPNEGLTGVFKRTLDAPNVDPARKDPANWPKEMLAELGNDDGLSARPTAAASASATISARSAKSSTISTRISCWSGATTNTRTSGKTSSRRSASPATTTRFALQPWSNGNGGKPNRWGEKGDWNLNLKGHREAAKYLATGLIEARHRHGLCLQAAAPSDGARLHQHVPLPGLGPEGVPLSGDPVRGELLRPQPALCQGRARASVRAAAPGRRRRRPARRRIRGAAWRSAPRWPRCWRARPTAWR